jgi:hypothetical protein
MRVVPPPLFLWWELERGGLPPLKGMGLVVAVAAAMAVALVVAREVARVVLYPPMD